MERIEKSLLSIFPSRNLFLEFIEPMPTGTFRPFLSDRGAFRADSPYDLPDIATCMQRLSTAPPRRGFGRVRKPYENAFWEPYNSWIPKWLRGNPCETDGWCGVCKPGRWLPTKGFSTRMLYGHGMGRNTMKQKQGPLVYNGI